MRELVLASTSASRRKILENAGLSFRCESPGVDERAIQDLDPGRLAGRLAALKAEAVARRHPDAIVIGSDQVGWIPDRGEILGKPEDPAAHREMLARMRGRPHELHCAFHILSPGFSRPGIEVVRLTVRADLSDAEIAGYVATGEGAYCAGGYAVEGRGIGLFREIAGDFFAILGLPLLPVLRAIAEVEPGLCVRALGGE